MSKQFQSVAEAAAYLADDPKAKESVEHKARNSMLVRALLSIRIQKGVTQKHIADFLKCNPSKISKMESGNDLNFKWIDIIGYLAAMNMRTSILVDDQSLPAATRIKQYVYRIKDLLDSLATLAKEVDEDTDITEKIHQFYGEVLFNFLKEFDESYDKLRSVIKIPEDEIKAATAQKKLPMLKRKKPVESPA